MQVNLSDIAANIEQHPDGLWYAKSTSAVSYPEDGNQTCFAVEDSSFWFRHRNQCLLQALKSYPPPGTFFDVGGGNGYVAQAIQEAGFNVVLVEPGPSGARNARERGIRQVVQATLDDAGFRPATLPAVGLFDVMEHVQDDRRFLHNVSRFLQPNGRVYITVPALQLLWSYEDLEAGHWRRYTVLTLREVLKQSGFEVEFCSYFFGFLPIPIFLFRALPFRLGIKPRRPASERVRADHQPQNAFVAHALSFLTRREISRLASGRFLRFGASCLAVARRLP